MHRLAHPARRTRSRGGARPACAATVARGAHEHQPEHRDAGGGRQLLGEAQVPGEQPRVSAAAATTASTPAPITQPGTPLPAGRTVAGVEVSPRRQHISVQLARLRWMALALARLRSVLTEREVEVSLLVAKGLTNEQIGHVLGVSANTIKGTLARAFRKLGIESRAELVATLFDGL